MAALIVVDVNTLDSRTWYLHHRRECSGWKAPQRRQKQQRNNVVLVIMEAPVPEDRWNDFQRAFHHAMKNRPKEVIASYLTHDIHDTDKWRITTLWVSHEAAMALYNAGATMPSMHTFHLVGITPEISISDVLDHI